MSPTIQSLIGNVKRKYTTEDFNPFSAVEWLYDNCLHSGSGHTILIVGHTKRFEKEVQKAWQHVLVSKKLLGGTDKLPVLSANEFVTHTGTVLRFENYPDGAQYQMAFFEAAKESSIIALFSKYESADFLNVIRERASTNLIYDFSSNNLKKVVDS